MLPELGALLGFLAATIALNLSPGPDMLYVISRSLEQGRRAGVISALGIGTGTLVHTLATAIGLSAILLSVPAAFAAIRYVGGAYLVYLGVRMLLSSRQRAVIVPPKPLARTSYLSVFRQGVITNVLNPKVALFFLAFLPQFVDYSKGSVALQNHSSRSDLRHIWNIVEHDHCGHRKSRKRSLEGAFKFLIHSENTAWHHSSSARHVCHRKMKDP